MRRVRVEWSLSRARDREPMHEEHAGRANVDVCPKCHGVFLDGIELHRVVGDKEIVHKLGRMEGKPADLPCPACAAPMVINTVDGITLDHCRACLGVWMDHGEMERLASRHLTTFARSHALGGTLRDIALSLQKRS